MVLDCLGFSLLLVNNLWYSFRSKHLILFCFSGFEDVCRAYAKALPVVQKEEGGRTPRFYVRCLAELDDFIQAVWEDKAGR